MAVQDIVTNGQRRKREAADFMERVAEPINMLARGEEGMSRKHRSGDEGKTC
ncbi:hypothetical protein [Rhizobium sp. CF142]|uniref:hypothetical protein n=1 Tax=Rhizobium sp. CF142 TaxID=1144314 RepID=UPI0012F6A07B|nr:hypothetical protein [Rhizobium sp. CF142]